MSKLEDLKTKLADVDAKLDAARKVPASNTATKSDVFGTPFARKGEGMMGSRGFMFTKAIALAAGVIPAEEAKVEAEVMDRLKRKFGYTKATVNTWGGKPTFFAPFGSELMCGDDNVGVDDQFRTEMKALTLAGTANFDFDEATAIARKAYGMKANQSWIDQTLGGGLVPTAAFGELIQLLRNKDALINAGAQVEALPPQGRLVMPRQTSPTTGYYVGENSAITSSNFGTGTLTLSAKKVAALVTLPNELLRYASPASEAVLRADLTKTLSLTMDYQFLYGQGSDVYPLGLINTPGVQTITPSDSNQLAPQDFYQFVQLCEQANGEFEGFILNPCLFYSAVQARAGVYNGSAIVNQGQFVYDQFRELGAGFSKILAGYKATSSNQVSVTRGNGSQTSCFGGQWSDYVIALFGSIEFAQATQGDTAFANDQTVVRGILSHDGAARHPGVFSVADPISKAIGV